jgi:DNA gyrase subunit B
MPLPGLVDACLVAGTRISLLDGRELTLAEIEKEFGTGEFWVYSERNGRIVPGAARTLRKTAVQAKLVEVELDNGGRIQCTPEHKFMLRDGSYKEARELLSGTSLMPLYRKINRDGYEEHLEPASGRWRSTHQRVAESVYGRPRSENDGQYLSGWHVHHGTYLPKFTVGMKTDNRPENLVWLPAALHWQLHHDLGMLTREQLIARNKSPRQRELCAQARKQYIVEHPEVISQLRIGHEKWLASSDGQSYLVSEERKQISSKTLSKLWLQNEYATRFRANLQKKDAAWLKALRDGIQSNRESNLPSYRANAVRQHRSIERLHAISLGGKARTCGTGLVYDRNLKAVLALVQDKLSNQSYNEARHKLISNGTYARLVPTYEKAVLANHKVVAVRYLDQTQDVYDFTVDGDHNFALSAGVFVHNSFDVFKYPFYEAVAGPAIAGTFSGIGHIELYFQWLTATAKVLSSEFDFEYDENTNTLFITPIPQAIIPMQVIYPAPRDIKNVPTNDEDIILDLALAYGKQMLARILRKFKEIPGSTLTIPTDGSELMQEGLQAETSVLETLKARALPPPFIIG